MNAVLSASSWISRMRCLRLRRITNEPRGGSALPDHRDRPGLFYIPLLHSGGSAAAGENR